MKTVGLRSIIYVDLIGFFYMFVNGYRKLFQKILTFERYPIISS